MGFPATRPFALALALGVPLLGACNLTSDGAGTAIGAAPKVQSLEIELRPDPATLQLTARATWSFSGRLGDHVDFACTVRPPESGIDATATDAAGRPLGIMPIEGGLRCIGTSGTNVVTLELGTSATDGVLFPRRGGRTSACLVDARSGSAPAWLPVPAGTDRVRVTSRFVLPANWVALGPGTRNGDFFTSTEELAVAGLHWIAGEFVRVDVGAGPVVLAPPDVQEWARADAPRIAAAYAALARTLGDASGPHTIVFTGGLEDGIVTAIPGACFAPVEWLGDERFRKERALVPDLSAALALHWFGCAAEVGPAHQSFARGLATYASDWILGPELGADIFARRLDAARAGAARGGSAERAYCFAHLARRTIEEGPFAHALRSLRPSGTPAEFVEALERASGQKLRAITDPWVNGQGVPEIDLAWTWSETERMLEIVVKQRQTPENGIARVFGGTVEVEVVSGRRIARHEIALEARESTARIPAVERPTWVRFDSDWRMPHIAVTPPDRNGVLARATGGETASDRVEALRWIGRQARETRDANSLQLYTSQLSDALTRGSSDWVRETAATELAQLGGLEARARLERAATVDASTRVRAAALRSLVGWTPDEALQRLADASFSEGMSWEVRAAAAQLYAAAAPERAAVWLSERIALASPHELLRAKLLDLWSRTGAPEVERTLVGWAGDDLASDAVRRIACERLVQLARSDRPVPEGLTAILEDRDPRWRKRALDALSAYNSRVARAALQRFATEATSSTEAGLAEAALRRR